MAHPNLPVCVLIWLVPRQCVRGLWLHTGQPGRKLWLHVGELRISPGVTCRVGAMAVTVRFTRREGRREGLG